MSKRKRPKLVATNNPNTPVIRNIVHSASKSVSKPSTHRCKKSALKAGYRKHSKSFDHPAFLLCQ